MRAYVRPELTIEAFWVEDLITDVSNPNPDFDPGEVVGGSIIDFFNDAASPAQEDKTAASDSSVAVTPKLEVYGQVDAAGSFNQEVTGGNPVQEGLNNIYENFLNKF